MMVELYDEKSTLWKDYIENNKAKQLKDKKIV